MKGLERIPSVNDRLSVYKLLEFSKGKGVSEADFALWVQWSRFDPRLAELLVSWLEKNWRSMSPLVLNGELEQHPWPEAAGVVLEFVDFAGAPEGPSESEAFRHWSALVMDRITPQFQGAQYFIGTRSFAGRLGGMDALFSLEPYAKWGFAGRDVLKNKSRGVRRMASAEARARAIRELIAKGEAFTVSDVLSVIGGGVSRRQVQRDLEEHPGLRRKGRTQGRTYLPR